ncbi:hypothetical protein ACTS9D_07075 [Empedobacter brevis]
MKLEEIIYDEEILKDYKKKSSTIKENIIKYQTIFTNVNSWQYKYLDFLILKFDKILICNFSELNVIKDEIVDIKNLSKEECQIINDTEEQADKKCECDTCRENNSKSDFSTRLQKILKYSNENLRNVISKKGLKTCYICNAQYAILALNEANQQQDNSIEGELQKREKAKFQIDHYYPKSLYPALSISLSNLYPICGYCNQIKNDNEYDLNDINYHLKYSLDIKSLQDYLSNNENLLELILKDNSLSDKKISEIFDLKGVYNNHLDEVEELIQRKIKYQESYKEKLVESYPELTLSNKNIDNRLILGTYSKEEGIYKRPLSKFLHDINDQLDAL